MTAKRTKSSSRKSKTKSKSSGGNSTPSSRAVKKKRSTDVVKLVARNAPVVRASEGPSSELLDIVLRALDDLKAVNVKSLDVRNQTDIADTMVIASGNSDRHVRSIAERVVEFAKKAGFRPFGIEGERDGEWVLVDLQDIIVHVMLPRVREFYRLESLWDVTAARREAARSGT